VLFWNGVLDLCHGQLLYIKSEEKYSLTNDDIITEYVFSENLELTVEKYIMMLIIHVWVLDLVYSYYLKYMNFIQIFKIYTSDLSKNFCIGILFYSPINTHYDFDPVTCPNHNSK
jgi:hypothetical protein